MVEVAPVGVAAAARLETEHRRVSQVVGRCPGWRVGHRCHARRAEQQSRQAGIEVNLADDHALKGLCHLSPTGSDGNHAKGRHRHVIRRHRP